jgi:hypothetical protein
MSNGLEPPRVLPASERQGLAEIDGARVEVIPHGRERVERGVVDAVDVRPARAANVHTRHTVGVGDVLRRAQQEPVQHVDHHGSGSDAERERQHRAQGEKRGRRETPQGVSNLRWDQSHRSTSVRRRTSLPSWLVMFKTLPLARITPICPLIAS